MRFINSKIVLTSIMILYIVYTYKGKYRHEIRIIFGIPDT